MSASDGDRRVDKRDKPHQKGSRKDGKRSEKTVSDYEKAYALAKEPQIVAIKLVHEGPNGDQLYYCQTCCHLKLLTKKKMQETNFENFWSDHFNSQTHYDVFMNRSALDNTNSTIESNFDDVKVYEEWPTLKPILSSDSGSNYPWAWRSAYYYNGYEVGLDFIHLKFNLSDKQPNEPLSLIAVCSLCAVKCYMKDLDEITEHVRSYKHVMNFVVNRFPKLAFEVQSFSGDKQRRERIDKYLNDYVEKGGLLNSDNFIRIRSRCVSKLLAQQEMIEPLPKEDQIKRATLFYMLIKMGETKEPPINPPTAVIECRQRLMGFRLLWELVLQEENGDQRSAYLCKLCGWITHTDRLLKHMRSFRHRLLFLERLNTANYSCGWANEIRLLIADGRFEEANIQLWSCEEKINWEKAHFDRRLNFVLSLSETTKKLVPSLWTELEEPTVLELKFTAPSPPPSLVSPTPVRQEVPSHVSIPNPVPVPQMNVSVPPPVVIANLAPPNINDDLAILITKLIEQQMEFGQRDKSFQQGRALFFHEILKAGRTEVSDCVLPPALLHCKDALIGLKFIDEVVVKDLDRTIRCFVCNLCGWIRMSSKLIVHLLSARHRLNTIRSCSPSWVAEIEYFTSSNDYHSADRLLAQHAQELGLVVGHERLNHRINGFITMDKNCKLLIPSLWKDSMESVTIKGTKQQEFLPELLQDVKMWLNLTPNPIPLVKNTPNPRTWMKTAPIKRQRCNSGERNHNRAKSNDEPHSKWLRPDSLSKPISETPKTKPIIVDSSKASNDASSKSKATIEASTQSKSANDIKSTPVPVARPARQKGLLDEGDSHLKAKSKVSFVSQPLPPGTCNFQPEEDICSPSFEPIVPESLPQSVSRTASSVTLSSKHSTSPPESSVSTTEAKTRKAIAPEIQQQLSALFNIGSKPIPQATMMTKSSKQPNLTNVVHDLPVQEVVPDKGRNSDDINIPIGMETPQVDQQPHSELTNVEMGVVASALASLAKKAETFEKSAAPVRTDDRKVMSSAKKEQTLHKPVADNVLSLKKGINPFAGETQAFDNPAKKTLSNIQEDNAQPTTPVAREAETFENSPAAAQILSMLQGGMSSVARDPQTLNATAEILSIIQGDAQPVAKAQTFEKSAAAVKTDDRKVKSPAKKDQPLDKPVADNVLSPIQGINPVARQTQAFYNPATRIPSNIQGDNPQPTTPVARDAETFKNSPAASQILSMLQGGMSSVSRDPQTLNAAAEILSIIQGDAQPVVKAPTFEKSAAEILSIVQGGDAKMASSSATNPHAHQKSMAEILSAVQGGGRKMVNPHKNKPQTFETLSAGILSAIQSDDLQKTSSAINQHISNPFESPYASGDMNVMSGFSPLIAKTTTVDEEPKLTSTVNYGESKIKTPENFASTSQKDVPSTSQIAVQLPSQDETIRMLEGLAAPAESKKSSMESILRKLIDDEKEKQKTQEQQQKMLYSLLARSLAKEDEDSSSDDDSSTDDSDDAEDLKKIAKRNLEVVKRTEVMTPNRSYRPPPPQLYGPAYYASQRPPPMYHQQPYRGPPVQSISEHHEPGAPGVDVDLMKLAERSLEAIKGTAVKKADSAPSNDNSVKSIQKEIADSENDSEKIAEKTVQPVIQTDTQSASGSKQNV